MLQKITKPLIKIFGNAKMNLLLVLILFSSLLTHAQFPAPYCDFTLANDWEPITLVNFAGINQTSGNTIVTGATATNQALTDYTSVIGTVAQGFSYASIFKGNTAGNYTCYFTVYIDWNQNGALNDAGEIYNVGTVLNSTGLDAIQATGNILVPSNALLGNTRMRVVKKFNAYTTTPCASTWGAAQDFTINVTVPPCVAPTATYTIAPNCGSGQFSVNVNITDMGSATSIGIGDGTNTYGPATAVGNYVAGPYASGDTKTITLTHDVNALCNLTSAAQTYNCPPLNDEATGATTLTVNADLACAVTTTGSTIASTQSTDAAPSCSATGINDDVWYTFTTAGVTAYQFKFTGVSAGTMAIALYSGTPGSLVPVTNACGSGATVEFGGLTPSTTYYARVYTTTATATTTANFTLCIGTLPNMTYVSSTTVQSSSSAVNAGSLKQQMIRTVVVATGLNSPLSLTQLDYNTTGSTNAADISNARVYYSGTSTTLDVTTQPQFGTTVVNPNGVFTVTGTQILAGGSSNTNNYFWLVYDIDCNAVNANVVDAQCTSVTVASTAQTPTATNPSGTRAIVGLVATNQPATSSISAGSINNQILRVDVLPCGASSNVEGITFSTTGSTNVADITSAKVYYTTSTTFATTTPFGTAVANPNGTFTVTGTQTLTAIGYFWLVYDLSCNAVVTDVIDASCSSVAMSGSTYVPATPNPTGTRAITAVTISAVTNQSSTGSIPTGSILQQNLRVAISGCVGSTVTTISFTTGTSNAVSDIASARVYYTTTTTFDNTVQFGSTVNNPAATFDVSGNLPLTASTGYFWLVYDIAASATVGNVVDASCVSAVLSGSTVTPATPNPTGTRTIAAGLANDNATGATSLVVGSGCTGSPYTNVGGTWTYGEPINVCYQLTTQNYSSVWFKFVAPASGMVRISTNYAGGTMTDTHLGLFTVGDVNNYNTFTLISCDDDNGTEVTAGGGGPALSLLYAAGLNPSGTYYIMVNGYNNGTGTFCLTVDEISSSMLTTTASCAAAQDLYVREYYTGSSSLVDPNGNLIAILKRNTPNAAGTTLNNYSGNVNVNTTGVRHDVNGLAYLDRNYRLGYSATTTSTFDVQLPFLNTELAALDAPLSTLNVSHVPGSTCSADFSGVATLLTQTSSGSVGGVSWIKVTTPGFSNFYIMSGITPLPLKLISFEGQNKGAVNNITWKTAEDKNLSHFELQRSRNGNDFATLANITAKNSLTGSKYEFTDTKPFEGKNLYRLNMVDVNGKSALSDVVVLSVKSSAGLSLTASPNPVTQVLNISIDGKMDGNAIIQVVDLTGKTVQKMQVSSNQSGIDMSALSSGTYIIKYNDNSNSSVIKVIKN